MGYQNLYRWEPGLEPEWVEEERRRKIESIMDCQYRARKKAEGIARSIANEIISRTGDLTPPDISRIMHESGLGPSVLKKVLEAEGHVLPDTRGGYPVAWPKWMCERVRMFVRENIIPGRYGDEWLTVDECVVELGVVEPDTLEYLTTRGMRMAMEVNGLKTIRRADGRGVVGYALRR